MMRFRNSVYYFMLRNIHTTAGQYSDYKHLLCTMQVPNRCQHLKKESLVQGLLLALFTHRRVNF